MQSVRHLAPEIICNIFENLSSPLSVHEAYKFPWYLGQICSEWREIFLSMQPHFWNKIVIESPEAQWEDSARNTPSSSGELDTEVLEDGDIQQDPARTMAILSFFLDITRGVPFSFTLYAEEPYTQNDAPYVQPIFSRLLDYSVQWENVTMQLRQPEILLLRNIKGRLPMLRALSLVEHYKEIFNAGRSALFHIGDIFEDAPLLTEIELDSLTWRFNWASLTSIHLHSFDGAQGVISALRQTINLETFAIEEVLYNDQVNAEETEIIKLPHLKELSIHGVLFLTILEAPALKELTIKFEEESGPDMEEPLEDSEIASRTIAFLRSRCELSKFSSESFASPALTDILSHMPDVQDLSLQVACLPYIYGVFEWLGGSDLPLRHLKVLSIFSFFEDSDMKPVREMMARRNPTVGAIGAGPKELRMDLNGRPRVETTVLKSLESLCEDRGIHFAFDSWEESIITVVSWGGFTGI